MTSNLDTLVTVFGGSGFLGRNVVRALCKRDYRVRVAVRRPELAGYLQPIGKVGQIHSVQANIRHPASIEAAMRDSHVAINLVGVLAESSTQTFDAVQAKGAETVATAASAACARMVHVSAIGADLASPSRYAASKAAGEAAVRAAFPAATILRPSVMFGAEDKFFNRFGAMAQLLPFMPVIAGGTKMQPVYVGDVADAVMAVLSHPEAAGAVYELGGPRVWTFREILVWILKETRRPRRMVDVPLGLARLQASLAELLPTKPLTRDQLTMLARDNVVAPGMPGLAELGILPSPAELIVPEYLGRYRPGGGSLERIPA